MTKALLLCPAPSTLRSSVAGGEEETICCLASRLGLAQPHELSTVYDYFFGKSFSMSPGFRAATPSGFFRRFTSRPGSARPRLS